MYWEGRADECVSQLHLERGEVAERLKAAVC